MSENISSLVGVLCVAVSVVGKIGAFPRWFIALDRILRGEATRPSALKQQSIDVPIGGLSIVLFGLAVSYGICMGVFSGFNPEGPSNMQWLACAIKVPALFFLTLCVTFPSLYVFNALVGSRLRETTLLQLLVASLAVNLAVLASLGPIVAFFSFCTTSSPFMLLLNVMVFALSGILGMVFLLQTLQRLSVMRQFAEEPSPQESSADAPFGAQSGAATGPEAAPPESSASASSSTASSTSPDMRTPYDLERHASSVGRHGPEYRRKFAVLPEEPSALDGLRGHVLGRHVKTIFVCWILTFGVVGGQMAWVLRPFFGSAAHPFVWFAPRESNFFEAVFHAMVMLLK
jgi:hypothetical protein